MYRILYIEDEIDMVKDLPPVMKEWGLDITATVSIEEAFRLFSKESFDAVLLDICMPPPVDIDPEKVEYGRETGVEVARRLKNQRPEVPIISLTVVTDPEIKARMRGAGICRIISKPEDPFPIADAILKEIKSAE
jgi:CheY-like chemotaxis protein